MCRRRVARAAIASLYTLFIALGIASCERASYQRANALLANKDYEHGLPELAAAAAAGDARAQARLGNMESAGDEIPPDYTRARFWLEKSAVQGNADGAAGLASLYYMGRGGPKDVNKAREQWEKAASQGNPYALAMLGTLYHDGEGVTRDYSQARAYYERASALGNRTATFALGVMYLNGEGVPKSFSAALHHIETAAKAGEYLAETAMGKLQYSGQAGLSVDYPAALEWFRKAAEEGDGEAQLNLAIMLRDGQGTHRNLVEALKWANIASASDQEDAAGARDALEALLSPSQIQKAQSLSAEWQKSHQAPR